MQLATTLMAGALAAAAFGLSAGGATARPGEATASVHVRSGPGVSYRVIDTLYAGERVNIRNCTGGWCYVVHPGPDGWVSGNYLTGAPRHHYRRPIYRPAPVYTPPPIFIGPGFHHWPRYWYDHRWHDHRRHDHRSHDHGSHDQHMGQRPGSNNNNHQPSAYYCKLHPQAPMCQMGQDGQHHHH